MEYNIIRVNNQLCKMYYSFSVEEMNEMYSDIVDTFTEIINLKNEPAFEVCLYDYIENHILDAKLSEEKIVCVSRKNIKRLTDFKKNVPYIGVATFATLPTDYSFVLPKKVEIIEDVSYFNKANAMFKEEMLKKGFYYREKINAVQENSIFVYDLIIKKNGVLVNTISNQQFDMVNDDDYDKKLFIGCAVGSCININQEEFVNEITIKSIFEKKPFNDESFDYTAIAGFRCETFAEFRNKFIDAAVRDMIQTKLLNKFIDLVLEENKMFMISNDLKQFYIKTFDLNEEDSIYQILKDYFMHIFCLKNNLELTLDETNEVLDDVLILELGEKEDEQTHEFISRKLDEYKILKGLKLNKIIN